MTTPSPEPMSSFVNMVLKGKEAREVEGLGRCPCRTVMVEADNPNVNKTHTEFKRINKKD